MPEEHLSDIEIRELTHYKQPAAQARALTRLQVPFKLRSDRTLLVGREALRAALGTPIVTTSTAPAANDEPRWSKQA